MGTRNGYFSRIVLNENIKLRRSMPDAEKVLSNVIDTELVSLKVKDSQGSYMKNGVDIKKENLVAEIKIKLKIMYSTKESEESFHIVEKEIYYIEYIPIPCSIEEIDAKVFVSKNKFKVDIKVEEIYAYPIDKRNIYISIFIILIAKLMPSYEICYSVGENSNKNGIYFMYEDGQKCIQALSSEGMIIDEKLQWSNNGKDIFFISNQGDKMNIYSIDSDNFGTTALMDNIFNYIDSFSLNKDGSVILFSAGKGEEENIYLLNLHTMKRKRLTKDREDIINYKPQFSRDGACVTFIKNISGIANIWNLNLKDKSFRKITRCGFIKDFTWFKNKNSLIYIQGSSSTSDRICSLDLNNYIEEEIELFGYPGERTNLNLSPDDKYLCYVIQNGDIDKLLLYNFHRKDITMITKNKENIIITDIIWKRDSSKFYYSYKTSNKSGINSVDIKSFKTEEVLLYDKLYNIRITYRPNIS